MHKTNETTSWPSPQAEQPHIVKTSTKPVHNVYPDISSRFRLSRSYGSCCTTRMFTQKCALEQDAVYQNLVVSTVRLRR